MTIELRNSDRLPAPAGFSHAAIAPPGQTVYLAGTIGTDAEGNFADGLAHRLAHRGAHTCAHSSSL